ncbi:baseplate J/gp47 family protein [Deferribacter autotrophicus]|uniref:Baseplate J/gp47 family protein n=1 Tax=Deferribacter autotrophicus TaxID=500465 RepID=A0A5A8EZW8_9BACT|nr:baseplate J/gp47 family protein [Deferribacter autotrophicus]KAA0257230.1 baseplate J/gp47 family protein [Deferribacter autotrophicus]
MDFVNVDTSKIEAEILQAYETISGKKLYPADPVRLILETVAYVVAILKNDINYTGKQNLLAYAKGEYLDKLGELLGVKRTGATNAITTLRFFVSEPLAFDVLIPQGTRVTPDNKIFFETMEEAKIIAGQLSVDVQAKCQTAGAVGNGFLPGQINQIVDIIPYVDSVQNVSVSYGGSNIESDEHLRERIRLAPESFSNAGSKGAYIFHTKSAHSEIEDVSVLSPSAGVVKIVFLMKDGALPNSDLIQIVQNYLNSETVRPLTDQVIVEAPIVVSYNIDLTYYIHKDFSTLVPIIKSQVEQAVNDFIAYQKTKIGRDILPEELIGRLKQIDGVYRIQLKSPTFTEILEDQVASAANVLITYGGLVDD